MGKIIKSETEWKSILTPQAYQVLRKHGTERAFSGEYNDHHEDGKFLKPFPPKLWRRLLTRVFL